MAIEITRFEKTNGPLTKRLHLDADGKLRNDFKNCSMAKGTMFRERLVDLEDFADLRENLARNEAIALGALPADLKAESVVLVTKDKLNGRDAAARTSDTITYREGEPALVLIDFDTKGMPPAVQKRITELNGLIGALEEIMPDFYPSKKQHRQKEARKPERMVFIVTRLLPLSG